MHGMVGFLNIVREDIHSVLQRDPAARSSLEVMLCYSGLHALWVHRLTHQLWLRGVRLPARLLSQFARFLTGVEIHPGAQIGRRVFIDHAIAVIVGETAVIGDDVTIYQGVTLGGTGKDKGKRHPTVGNNVVIGAGAKVLGNIVVGNNCRIGAGSVVVRNVPDNSTVIGVPGKVVHKIGNAVLVTDTKEITDPVSDAIARLTRRLEYLEQQAALWSAINGPSNPAMPKYFQDPGHSNAEGSLMAQPKVDS